MPSDVKQLDITITGKNHFVDVDSLSHVMDDTLIVLRELEASVTHKESSVLIWRVSHASVASPMTLTVFGDPITGPSSTGKKLAGLYVKGLEIVQSGPQVPPHFSDRALVATKHLVTHLKNGVASLRFEAPGFGAVSPTFLAAKNVDVIMKSRPEHYYHLTSIEGTLELLSIRGGGFMAQIYTARTKQHVKCDLSNYSMSKALKFFGKRVAAYGRVKYAKTGIPIEIEVRQIRGLRGKAVLPQFDDLEGINISGDMDPTDYIRSLRDAN